MMSFETSVTADHKVISLFGVNQERHLAAA